MEISGRVSSTMVARGVAQALVELHERSWRAARALMEIDDGFAQNFGPVVGTYEGHLPLSEQR